MMPCITSTKCNAQSENFSDESCYQEVTCHHCEYVFDAIYRFVGIIPHTRMTNKDRTMQEAVYIPGFTEPQVYMGDVGAHNYQALKSLICWAKKSGYAYIDNVLKEVDSLMEGEKLVCFDAYWDAYEFKKEAS